MGGANNRSLISAHFCISAYFLTAETYKRMRLTTRVYGIYVYTCKSQVCGRWPKHLRYTDDYGKNSNFKQHVPGVPHPLQHGRHTCCIK